MTAAPGGGAPSPPAPSPLGMRMDPEPHGGNLCQRQGASCGACCGLYNRADLSRAAVREDLRRSTALLARTAPTPEAFRAAAAARSPQLPAPVFPSIRICPLLGFLDAAEERVGCLAHPRVTGGADLRACGVYDVLTCDAFLCPSHAHLREEEAALVAGAAARDFHLYGLVVTDAPFVHAVLGALAGRTGLRPAASDLRHAPFQAALRALLALKEELEPGSEGLFGAFRVRQAGAAMGGSTPAGEENPEDRILDALGADVSSGNDEDGLRAEIVHRLERCAAALAAAARAPRASGG